MLCESVKMCDEFFIAGKVTVQLLQMLTFQTSCKHTSVYIVSYTQLLHEKVLHFFIFLSCVVSKFTAACKNKVYYSAEDELLTCVLYNKVYNKVDHKLIFIGGCYDGVCKNTTRRLQSCWQLYEAQWALS